MTTSHEHNRYKSLDLLFGVAIQDLESHILIFKYRCLEILIAFYKLVYPLIYHTVSNDTIFKFEIWNKFILISNVDPVSVGEDLFCISHFLLRRETKICVIYFELGFSR